MTRLAAVEEAAAMDVLCSDKTGTITANSLAVATVLPYPPATEVDVLAAAAMASDESTQDPIDLAILAEATAKHAAQDPSSRLSFVPFDSATKRSEATYQRGKDEIHVAKGAPRWIAPLCTGPAESMGQDEAQLAAQGHRVLAIAAGSEKTLQLTGLIALHDPPRADSQNLIKRLKAAGIRVIMVTGDGLATARAVAASVGIGDRACGPERLRSGPQASSDDQIDNCDVIAEVLPEDKFALVQALQARGHTTGMTGDGVNDAPALKQAQVGVAVASATDVAKAAASMVLTQPGLGNIVAAVEESRRIYQRMLTYTLNKIIKTVNIVLFLSLGFIFTRDFVVTPLLIVLMMFANDFATMSIATDRVVPSPKPDRWNIRSLIVASIAIGTLLVALSFLVWWLGADVWHLSTKAQQTLNFVMLVFSGQGTIYLVRERRHFWRSRPSRVLLVSSVTDLIVIGLLAGFGLLMTAIPVTVIAATVAIIIGYLVLVDFAKLYLFADLHM